MKLSSESRYPLFMSSASGIRDLCIEYHVGNGSLWMRRRYARLQSGQQRERDTLLWHRDQRRDSFAAKRRSSRGIHIHEAFFGRSWMVIEDGFDGSVESCLVLLKKIQRSFLNFFLLILKTHFE